MENVYLKFISNAGVLLKYCGTSVLIDGVYDAEELPFSSVPQDVWSEMLNGCGEFENIDYLLFTHAHPDHFSPTMVVELLRRRRVTGLFLPETAENCGELLSCASECGTKVVLLSKDGANAEHMLGINIRLNAILTGHLDVKYSGVQHICYLLSFDEKQLLFTADMDYMVELPQMIREAEPFAMFVNPLYFHMLRNRAVSLRAPHAERIYVYHIPFEEDDDLGMRARLEWDMSRWDNERKMAFALNEKNMELRL